MPRKKTHFGIQNSYEIIAQRQQEISQLQEEIHEQQQEISKLQEKIGELHKIILNESIANGETINILTSTVKEERNKKNILFDLVCSAYEHCPKKLQKEIKEKYNTHFYQMDCESIQKES